MGSFHNISRSRAWYASASLFLALTILHPRESSGTPAYARRYDTKCATCHSPLPPRLNNVGMVFRRMGFRLPDADENGNLTTQMISAQGIGDALSLSADFRVRHDSEAEVGTSRSTMELGEIELVAGSAIGDHLSAQMMFLPRSEEGEAELEDIETQANGGSPRHQASVRAGLLQTFLWQKAGHGRLTPSMPLVLSEEPAAPVGDFAGFALGVKQVGVEAGYTLTKLQGGKLQSTMLSASVLNGVSADGMAANRNPTDGVDVLLQALHLFGSRNTVGALYYHGRTVVDPEGLLPVPGPFKDHFDREGLIASYAPVEWLELLGSAVAGKDRADQLGRTVSTLGGYAEVTGTFREHWIGTYRWEQLDPDRDSDGDLVHAHVLATTCQVWDYLLLSAEYRKLITSDGRPYELLAVVRLTY